MTLSGARNLEFEAVSDFIAQLSLIIKGNTIQNINNTEDENISLPEQINTGRIFDPVVNDPLDDVLEIEICLKPNIKNRHLLMLSQLFIYQTK